MSEFTPPTPEQVEALFDRHPPRPPSRWVAKVPLLVLGALVVMVVLVPPPLGLILPWLGLGGMIAFLLIRLRRNRKLESDAMRTQELAQLECHHDAVRQAWQLVPRLETRPALYLRNIALMADSLLQIQSHESALVAYELLLRQLPEEHPAAIQLRIRRAMADLGLDHLADADDALRKVRGQIEPYEGTGLAAAYHLARLMQDVRTHHFADALATGDDLLEKLRPLGVEAGYGHGLLALCGRKTGEEDLARQWWRRAVTLLSEAALVYRFPELEAMRHSP